MDPSLGTADKKSMEWHRTVSPRKQFKVTTSAGEVTVTVLWWGEEI
jgi:hypothetical protein